MNHRTTFLSVIWCCAAGASAQPCDWLERNPANLPSETSNATMCFDSVRGHSLLVRGYQQTEVWAWNGEEWSLLSTGGPSGRTDAALVFDEARGVALYFGGYDEVALGDFWAWDGSAWSTVFFQTGPLSREGHVMAYDSDRDVTVLYGGVNTDGDYFTDTWEWDGEQWMKRDVSGPGKRRYSCMTYDPIRHTTVLFSGFGNGRDTWGWDGEVWTKLATVGPDNRDGSAMVFDEALGMPVLFGGLRGAQDKLNDTWAWDGQVWTEILFAPEDRPPPRFEHTMAYDPVRGAAVVFGGDILFHGIVNDTWELTCAPPCYPDLDASGKLDLFDFLTFLNLFNAADPVADCDPDGQFTLFDFLCFNNAFNAGC